MIGSLCGVEGALAEAFKHMPDEGRRVTMSELLVLFKAHRLAAIPSAPAVICARSVLPAGFGCARLATLAFAAPHPAGRTLQTDKVLFC